ncbi:hypothetical protein COV16_00165 [Candidatus Woesearchaeota archaeon CG10_big_fil_rev_8_21_14_0_10_34_8]|jgi:hypothetical protein|nr:MAG: hypothetical protein COV16_00165 [Candidatus Woesearchaeota archaeon CG10_big_fil_rev_8_21_14_0_10_34_8]
MVRPKIDYVVDLFLTIAFLGVAVTGVIKWPGLFKFTNLNLYVVRLIHDWSGIIMAALVLLHLVMHWKWIVATTKSFFEK